MALILVVDDVATMAEQYAFDLKRIGGFDVRRHFAKPVPEFPLPDVQRDVRIVAGAPEHQVEHPVPLLFVPLVLVRPIGEDPPSARRVAVALVRERREDLETATASEQTASGEAGAELWVAP